MDKKEQKHYEALLSYVHHPDRIGIPEKDIESCIVEPIWYNSPEEQKSLCDIIFVLNNDLTIPTEVKRSKDKRDKAKNQLDMGKIYSENILYRPPVYGIIAFYLAEDFEEYHFS